MGGKKLTGWGKNGPAFFFPGERMGRPILSPGKKLTGGKFRPVTPARSHTFVEIDHEIISTVILLPSAESFMKGCCQLQAKVCARLLVNCLFKLAKEKVLLGELTVPQ